MTDPERLETNPQRLAAERLIIDSRMVLRDAVEAVAGNPELDPLVVFAPPGERRDDAPDLDLDPDQTQALRSVAEKLGANRETDLTAKELGASKKHKAVLQGGQPGKEKAQLENALGIQRVQIGDEIVEGYVLDMYNYVRPESLVVAASPYRKIGVDPDRAQADAKEVQDTIKVLDLPEGTEVKTSEYENAEAIIRRLPGFEADEEVLPFGYDIYNDFAVNDEPTGQFRRLGTVNGIPVVLMAIDRQDHYDERGKVVKYTNQPKTVDTLQIVDRVLKAAGDDDSDIVYHTSQLYLPGERTAALQAGIQAKRAMHVAAYGKNRLAEVRGLGAPAPLLDNQLPGELHKAAKNLVALESVLGEL